MKTLFLSSFCPSGFRSVVRFLPKNLVLEIINLLPLFVRNCKQNLFLFRKHRKFYATVYGTIRDHPISTFCKPHNMFLSTPKFLVVDLSCYEDSRRFLTVAECLKVLKRSTSLKECHLDSVYSPEIFPSPMPLDRFHSKLEHLDTTLIRWAAVSLFDSITLPSVNFASAIQKISS